MLARFLLYIIFHILPSRRGKLVIEKRANYVFSRQHNKIFEAPKVRFIIRNTWIPCTWCCPTFSTVVCLQVSFYFFLFFHRHISFSLRNRHHTGYPVTNTFMHPLQSYSIGLYNFLPGCLLFTCLCSYTFYPFALFFFPITPHSLPHCYKMCNSTLQLAHANPKKCYHMVWAVAH